MDYAQQRNPTKHLVGLGVVVVFHIVLVWALVNGLARKVIEVVKGPLETKIIQEVKPPPPEAPPPPPPKFAPPPQDFIPPPEVNIAVETPPPNAISAVTSKPQPPAPPVHAATGAAHVPPVVNAAHCRKPEYPAASQRLGEEGVVVLQMLVDVDGKVVDSKVLTSSGHPRLDDAARQALSLCKFTPGSFEGKPEKAWSQLSYRWENPND